jgi:hypothetical protein
MIDRSPYVSASSLSADALVVNEIGGLRDGQSIR